MYTLHILVRTDARKLSEYSEFELGGKFSTMLSSSKKGLTRRGMETMKGGGGVSAFSFARIHYR